ncbi:F-box protein At2g35280-like [Rutidosis leptorrhynchoides]|uniref:F-box protein At2g35280-like n=1 Tax=Rutidosis leptorrhynchoides TaxID=125765 RepID=UPI003A99A3A6
MEVTQPKTIKNLPRDMLVEILSRVGSYSSDQLFMCKSVCRSFSKLSKDPLVLKRLSLDRWPLLPWGNPRFFVFLFRYTIFGNPNAIFHWGLIGYFDSRHIDYGLECLKQASNSQLKEAVYVYGLIMFASFKIEKKHVGLQILNETFPPEPEMVVAKQSCFLGYVLTIDRQPCLFNELLRVYRWKIGIDMEGVLDRNIVEKCEL